MAFTGSNWGRRVKLTGLTPASSLSGFVALITLDNIPTEAIDAGANSALNGGGDLRFSTDDAGTNQLPCEIVSFVTSATAGLRKCEIKVRFSTYSSAAGEVWMFYKKAGESQPVVTSTYGRNSVWADYHNSYPLNSTTDSAGNNDLTSTGVTLGDDADFGSGENYLTSNSNGPSGTGNISIGFKMNTTQYVGGANHHMINIGTAASNSMFLIIKYNHKLKFGAWGGGGLGNVTVDDGVDHWVYMTSDGTTARLYVDGVLDATDSVASMNIVAAPMHFGHYRGGGSAFAYDGTLDDLILYNGTLSADHISLEHSNRSDPAAFWTVGTPENTTGGGGVTLICGSGSYALSGAEPALRSSRRIAGNSGAYSLSGTDASLLKSSKLSADSGSYSISGTDATLTYTPNAGTYTLSCDSGNYVLTGSTLALLAARKIEADSGSYALSVSVADLIHGYTLAADSGVYSFTGTDVDFLRAAVLSADSGEYVISGANVTLNYSQGSAEPYKTYFVKAKVTSFIVPPKTTTFYKH